MKGPNNLVYVLIAAALAFYAIHRQIPVKPSSQAVTSESFERSESNSELVGRTFAIRRRPRNKSLTVKRRRFPDLILAGVKKCGTKFFTKSLEMLHSQVLVSSPPEVHFFDRLKEHNQNFSWYLDRMPLATDDMIVMEKTPRYFVHPGAPRNISMLRGVKVLLTICNPVVRTLSDYLMYLRMGYTNKTLEDLLFLPGGKVDSTHYIIANSTYALHMPTWLAHFKLGDNLEIVDGDNFVKKPWVELQRVQDFLGIDEEIKEDMFVFSKEKGYYCIKQMNVSADSTNDGVFCLGEGKGHDHSHMLGKDKIETLGKYFEPFNRELFEMLGRSYNWTGVET